MHAVDCQRDPVLVRERAQRARDLQLGGGDRRAVAAVAAEEPADQDAVDLARPRQRGADPREHGDVALGAAGQVDRIAGRGGRRQQRGDLGAGAGASAATGMPARSSRPAASAPWPPPSATTAIRRPRGRGAAQQRVGDVDQLARRAHAMDPGRRARGRDRRLAARQGARVRQRRARHGGARLAPPAARPACRPRAPRTPPRAARARRRSPPDRARSARVGACCASIRTSGAAPSSAWSPSDANRLKPRPASAAKPASSIASCPLWEMKPIEPDGIASGTSSSSVALSSTPMQLGPSSTAPASATRRCERAVDRGARAGSRRSRARPATSASSTIAASAAARARPRRRARPVARAPTARLRRLPEHLAAAVVHEVHGAPGGAAQRAARQPVAPLGRVVGRADDRDGRRVEERFQASVHKVQAISNDS